MINTSICSFSWSFTSRIHICDQTNIRSVAIENPQISPKICPDFTATQRISMGSQIWMLEMKELIKLHNLRSRHVMIGSELKYLIGSKVMGTVKWTRGPGWTRPKNCRFLSVPGDKPAKTKRVGLLGGSRPGQGPSVWFQPGPKLGNPEPLLTITLGQ